MYAPLCPQVQRIDGYKTALLGNLVLACMGLEDYSGAVAACNKALEWVAACPHGMAWTRSAARAVRPPYMRGPTQPHASPICTVLLDVAAQVVAPLVQGTATHGACVPTCATALTSVCTYPCVSVCTRSGACMRADARSPPLQAPSPGGPARRCRLGVAAPPSRPIFPPCAAHAPAVLLYRWCPAPGTSLTAPSCTSGAARPSASKGTMMRRRRTSTGVGGGGLACVCVGLPIALDASTRVGRCTGRWYCSWMAAEGEMRGIMGGGGLMCVCARPVPCSRDQAGHQQIT